MEEISGEEEEEERVVDVESGKCFLLSRLKFLYLFLSLSFSSS